MSQRSMFTNSYGFCGLTELGGVCVIAVIILSVIALVAYAVSLEEQLPLSETHPAFSGLDCELMRDYIINRETHTHHLLIYAERCL